MPVVAVKAYRLAVPYPSAGESPKDTPVLAPHAIEIAQVIEPAESIDTQHKPSSFSIVSTQFRTYPFEKALLSALNRVMLNKQFKINIGR